MVVKTETCFYSELRIYPGHGRRIVRRDGKLLIFINSRCIRHYENRKKAMYLRWTQSWRRDHKKVKIDKVAIKKTVKKTAKVFKAFSGITLEDLKARRAAGPTMKKAEPAAPKAKKTSEEKKNKPKTQSFQKVPKHIRMTKAQANSK